MAYRTKRTYSGTVKRYKPLVRAATKALVRYATRTRSVGTQTQTATRGLGDNPLTTQHDYKTDYKRRRRTWRMRRRMRRGKRFTRRVVNAYMRATSAPKHVAKQELYTRTSGRESSSQFSALLHTVDGRFTGTNPQADWREFFIEGGTANKNAWDNAINPVTGPLNPEYPNRSNRYRALRSNHATIEVTVRNTGTTPCLINAYRVVCRQNVHRLYGDIETLYAEGFRRAGRVSEDQDQSAAPTELWDPHMTPAQLASTPFQSRLFCQAFTILRRTKYQLAPGEEFNLLYSDRRKRVLYQNKIRDSAFVRGLTTGWFFDFNGVPIVDQIGTTTADSQVSVLIQKRYSISFLPEKRYETSHDTQDPDA